MISLQKKFRNRSKFEITEDQAFQKNVLKKTVIPDKVGSVLRSDLDAYIARTFLLAKPRFKHLENYNIYATCTLTVFHAMDTQKMHGGELIAKTKSYTHAKTQLRTNQQHRTGQQNGGNGNTKPKTHNNNEKQRGRNNRGHTSGHTYKTKCGTTLNNDKTSEARIRHEHKQ